MRLKLLISLLILLPGALAQTLQKSNLTRLLEAEMARIPAKSGIYVKHLGTGEEAIVHGDDHFNSASVIKIPVMVLAYRLAEQGKLNLNDRVTIQRSDLRGGSGILKFHDVGLNPTIRDLITQMIITSDNTATDMMIAKVGGRDKVNEFLKQSGFNTLHLVQTVNELFRKTYEVLDPKYKSLTPEDVFALQSNNPAYTEPRQTMIKQIREESSKRHLNQEVNQLYIDNEAYWLGIITPTEVGRMLEGIEKDTIASNASCDEMRRIMRAQQSGARRIPHYLTVPVAHKTGDLGNVANDVGMVYARSGTIVISFCTLGITGVYAETEDRIGQIARLIVEYFDGPR